MSDLDHMHKKVFIKMNLCSEDKYMEVSELFEPYEKTYEVCQAYYSKAELDQRIEQACREQRGLFIKRVNELYEIYQKKCDTWPEMAPPATDAIEEVLDVLSATSSEGE